MLMVKISDVEAANQIYCEWLNTCAQDAINIRNSIDSFISKSSTELKGYGFDAVRGKIGQYMNAFDTLNKYYDTLSNNFKAANNDMINYISPETELSNEFKAELEENIRQAELLIDELWAKINKKIQHYDYVYVNGKILKDGNGNPVINHWEEYAYSESERSQFKQQILNYRLDIAKFKKIIKKIDELPANDAAFFASIASSDGDISSFTSKVGALNPNFFSDYA